MKKLFFVFSCISSLFICSSANAQQWAGSTSTTGNIYRGGNVGIGTVTAPGGILELANTTPILFGTPHVPITFIRLNNVQGNMIDESGYIRNVWDIRVHSYAQFPSLDLPGLDIVTGATLDPFSSSPPAVTTFSSVMKLAINGNVGIGTTNPARKLHVHNGGLRITGTSPGVFFGSSNANGSGTEQWGIEYIPSASSPRPGLNFKRLSNNYYLFLGDNGNVGIGTDNPGTFRLAVEGKIGAREIKVTLQNPWPDYVFDPGYSLMNLDDLACYIEENNHLPGMPSATEIRDNEGIELGDMQVKQMEKIEELYLLLIDMNEKLKAVTDENEQLKNRISSLEK